MVEIRFGEGGRDSKDFVDELTGMYGRYCANRQLKCELLDCWDGGSSMLVSGSGAWAAFKTESGKHVVQRCPPTERGGRRHTSMVTVAVLPVFEASAAPIREGDIEVSFQTSRGPGGQGVNTSNTCCRMHHKPTGVAVRVQVYRSQQQNRAMAYKLLCGRVQDDALARQNAAYGERRRAMLGDSGRGGARRTYNFYKGFVADHGTGRQTNDIKAVMKGKLEVLGVESH